MYTDEVHLTPNNVLAVLYASKKYIVTKLTKKCTQFLEENVSAETAPQLLEQSMLFDEKELKNKVLNKIEEEASEVLSSEDFINLSSDALHEVLQLKLKITKELEVFEAAMRWAQNKCQQLKKSTEGANLREVLDDKIFLIRFPTMSVDEFSNVVAPYDVLSSYEGYQVLLYITAKTNKRADLPFPTEPRICQTHPTAMVTTAQTPADPTPRRLMIPAPYTTTRGYGSGSWNTHLQCQLSRPIQLRKIMIHCGYEGWRQIDLRVELTQNGRNLQSYRNTNTSLSSGPPEHLAAVLNDVRVDAGAFELDITLTVTLTVSVTVTGLVTYGYRQSFSAATTSQLSDDCISITFPPVDENLLMGIEYSPVV